MSDKLQHSIQLFTKLYANVPSFVDIFDEETFYIFAALVVVGTFLTAFILSRFITLKEAD